MGELVMIGKKELFDFFDLTEKNIKNKNAPEYINFLIESILNGETFDKSLIDAEILERMHKLYKLIEKLTPLKTLEWQVLKRIAIAKNCPPYLIITILTDAFKAVKEKSVEFSENYFNRMIVWMVLTYKNSILLEILPTMDISFNQLELLTKLLYSSDNRYEFSELYEVCLNHPNYNMNKMLEEFVNS